MLDYMAYPIEMLLTAPGSLHHLGVAQYGLWVVATAAVSAVSIIASGFGDANIQLVAKARSHGGMDSLVRAVQSTMGINLLLGAVLALISWIFRPLVSRRIALPDIRSQCACRWSIRISSLLILGRVIESVCIGTQRAFERYGTAVRIGIFARILSQVVAVPLACRGSGTISIMVGSAALIIAGATAQLVRLRQHLGKISLLPSFDQSSTAALFSFGIFSWFQAVSCVIFTQVDRLTLGVSLVATSVAAYVRCIQMALPVYDVTAVGFYFLFSHLADIQANGNSSAVKKKILFAFFCNSAFVAVGTATVLLWGHTVLYLWIGESIAEMSITIFSPVVWGFASLGLSITGYYSMLALGQVRIGTMLSMVGGVITVALIILLPASHGGFWPSNCSFFLQCNLFAHILSIIPPPALEE